MLRKSLLGCELSITHTNTVMVIDAELGIFHEIALCAIALKPIVCPKRCAQKSDATEIRYIVVQERDVRSDCSSTQFSANLCKIRAVKLMVARYVKDWDRPIFEKLYRLCTAGDVPGQNQDISINGRRYKSLAREDFL